MTANAIAEPTFLPNYVNNARRLLGERYAKHQPEQWNAANQLTQFIKSIDRLFTAICRGLPPGNLVIEDMMINGDKLVVKYKAQDETTETLSNDKAVAVKSLDILNLSDGSVIERRNTVYQIKVD